VRTIDGERPGSMLRRDLSLLRRMAAMLVQYATAGAALRRRYRRCQESGEVLWVDALGKTRHREEPLRPR
jgi:hypothetical protein